MTGEIPKHVTYTDDYFQFQFLDCQSMKKEDVMPLSS